MKFLILSDIHGNWPALRAVLAAAPEVDAILCLGDLVNYGPHPVECVRWARDETVPLWIVQGNHDRAFGCDEDPRCSGPYRPLAAAMQHATATKLSDNAKHYLASLPTMVEQTFSGVRCVLCHATPSDPLYAYLPPGAESKKWAVEVARAGAPDFLFVGHTHLPFTLEIDGTVIVNPGSVGQPKTGDPRACCAIWDNDKVTLHRVAYDVQAVARDLEACVPGETAAQLIQILLTGGEPAPVGSS